MKKRKTWVKYMAVILAVLCVLMIKGDTVRAASADQYINLAGVFDSNGEVIFASPAIALEVDGIKMIFTSQYSGSTDGTQPVIVTAQDNQYGMVYADDMEYVPGHIVSVWGLDESAADYGAATKEILFLQLGDSVQNENAVAVFLDAESLEVETLSMTLRECDNAGLLTADAYPSGALYPAALIGEDGDLVGLCFGDGVAWAVYGGAAFYGDASQPQEPEKAPPLPDREERQQEPSSNPSSGETQVPASEPNVTPGGNTGTAGKSSFQTNLMLAIGMAVVIAIIIAIGIAVKNKKSKQTSASAPSPSSVPTPAPAPAIPSAPSAEDTGKTMPVSYHEDSGPIPFTPAPSPSGGQQKYWLAARGGSMNGRVYPVEAAGVTIGRDASSVIRYAADAPGVSRVHAKLYWQGGQLMLMDCNSSSGTYLKRQGKLAPMTPVVLQNGDVFYIGEKANAFEVRN